MSLQHIEGGKFIATYGPDRSEKRRSLQSRQPSDILMNVMASNLIYHKKYSQKAR